MTRVWSEDDKHCLECDYHFLYKDNVCCDYIMQTGQRRGCKPGLGCKRFQQTNPNPTAQKKARGPEPRKPVGKRLNPQPKQSSGEVNIHQATGKMGGRPKNRDAVEIDRERMNQVRAVAGGLATASKALGLPIASLGNGYCAGHIKQRYADMVLEHYGIDIRLAPGKTPPEAGYDGTLPIQYKCRAVEKLDEGGNVIARYDSVYEAAAQEGYARSSICRFCRNGKRYRYAEVLSVGGTRENFGKEN